MSAEVRVGGSSKKLTGLRCCVGGSDKAVKAGYVMVGGASKQFFTSERILFSGSSAETNTYTGLYTTVGRQQTPQEDIYYRDAVTSNVWRTIYNGNVGAMTYIGTSYLGVTGIMNGIGYNATQLYTDSTVDVTGFTRIYFNYDVTGTLPTDAGGTYPIRAWVSSAVPLYYPALWSPENFTVRATLPSEAGTYKAQYLDISGVSGNVYIGFTQYVPAMNGESHTTNFTRIWLGN